MKQLILNDLHTQLGGKMVPFAGFSMPVQYEGVNAEHQTVRQGVGVFDVSHMGEFFVSGEGALPLIQQITTNDVATLTDGKAQYSCMPNGKGGIVDDLIVYRLSAQEYMLVVNASNIEKDWQWINEHNTFGAKIENRSEEYCLFAVQGPLAVQALQPLTPVDLTQIPYYHFVVGEIAGIPEVIISATGYTGSGGFELYVKNENALTLWNKIFEAGAPLGIKPIGLAARDTLRLEMGFCLYGNDITDETSPLEAGLGWITKFTKDFVDAERLAQQKQQGITRKLVAFQMQEKAIPRHDYPIVNASGEPIGVVTSGTMSPSLGVGIGLGYVAKEYARVGSEIFVQIRKKNVPAQVVKLPFYKK